jgi:flagellar motor switch/type III secretory pathway protein FliN
MDKVISSVTVVGEPDENFEMFTLAVAFNDSTDGIAYAKSDSPPYKEGDSVEVNIAGQVKGGDHKGKNKLKISKGGFNSSGGGSSSAPAKQAEPVNTEAAIKIASKAQTDAAKLSMMALEVSLRLQSVVGEDKMPLAEVHTWARQMIINWERSGAAKAVTAAYSYDDAVERVRQAGNVKF